MEWKRAGGGARRSVALLPCMQTRSSGSAGRHWSSANYPMPWTSGPSADAQAETGMGSRLIRSFLHVALEVREVKPRAHGATAQEWRRAGICSQRSVEPLPRNASAL